MARAQNLRGQDQNHQHYYLQFRDDSHNSRVVAEKGLWLWICDSMVHGHDDAVVVMEENLSRKVTGCRLATASQPDAWLGSWLNLSFRF